MPKSAGGRILSWIPRRTSIPPAPRFVRFCRRRRGCRNGGNRQGTERRMREIVLDTETTGLDPMRGDRLVEIGCIELLNRIPSGQTFHRYLNPQRDMPAEAFAVHGLSAGFPSEKPLFAHVVEKFLAF